MRIIAGKNKGRKLVTLPGLNTRPMTDRMKEAVFNTIGPYFCGGIVLDLFGGSGALSLEALSRGCDRSYIIDASSAAIRVINTNIKNSGEQENVIILKSDYNAALNKLKKDAIKFDVVFIDPPYKLIVIEDVLLFLIENNMAGSGAYIICHFEKDRYNLKERDGLDIIKTYVHAQSEVVIYKKS